MKYHDGNVKINQGNSYVAEKNSSAWDTSEGIDEICINPMGLLDLASLSLSMFLHHFFHDDETDCMSFRNNDTFKGCCKHRLTWKPILSSGYSLSHVSFFMLAYLPLSKWKRATMLSKGLQIICTTRFTRSCLYRTGSFFIVLESVEDTPERQNVRNDRRVSM